MSKMEKLSSGKDLTEISIVLWWGKAIRMRNGISAYKYVIYNIDKR